MADTMSARVEDGGHSAEELKRQIEQAEGRIGQLSGDLLQARDRRNLLIREYNEITFGIRKGMVVKSRDATYQVSHAEDHYICTHGMPSIYGYKIKKDGTPGANCVYIGTSWTPKS